MHAVYLESLGGSEALRFGDLPIPRPAASDVLIRVHATTVTPTELQWFPTFKTRDGAPRSFPIVLSHEFSGVVAEVGADVEGLKVGDCVYGLNDWFANGALAEYCVASTTTLAAKPTSLDHLQSAVVPISALTAWQGLFERVKLQKGERVLVHGAAGAVGVFAVQLAHSCGAHVSATASASNVDFVRSLGADVVIDYHTARFEAVVGGVDVVFDGVGGETLERSWSVLAPGGRLVTIAAESEATSDQRTRDAFMLVRADGAQLRDIGAAIDAGKLQVFVADVFALTDARQAFARAQQGRMRGKIAVRVAA